MTIGGVNFFRNIKWWLVVIVLAVLILVIWVRPLGRTGAGWDEANRAAVEALEAGKLVDAEKLANAAMRSLDASDLSDVRVGDSFMLLGMIYEKTNRPEKAAEAYRRAVDVYRTSLGASSPAVGDALLSLATVHSSQSQWAETEAAASAALKNFQMSDSPRADKVAAAEALLTAARQKAPTTQKMP